MLHGANLPQFNRVSKCHVLIDRRVNEKNIFALNHRLKKIPRKYLGKTFRTLRGFSYKFVTNIYIHVKKLSHR